jgi:small subunit ribosomal protein S4
MQDRAKHKLCRRLGACIWGKAKCPSARRPYPAGQHGKNSKSKLSTYGELLLQKQRLKVYYGLSEKQLHLTFVDAKKGRTQTDQKLLHLLEFRLDAATYRSGLAPTIHAARQFVVHRHILVDGKIVDRPSYRLRPGQVISINVEKDPAIATVAKNANCEVPPYLEVDKENCKVKVIREPLIEENPSGVEIMRVVEFYAR